jgi:hypothetical protein
MEMFIIVRRGASSFGPRAEQPPNNTSVAVIANVRNTQPGIVAPAMTGPIWTGADENPARAKDQATD